MQINGQEWKNNGTGQRIEGKCDGYYIQSFPRRLIVYGFDIRLHGVLIFPIGRSYETSLILTGFTGLSGFFFHIAISCPSC
jgi:hypothetical protein